MATAVKEETIAQLEARLAARKEAAASNIAADIAPYVSALLLRAPVKKSAEKPYVGTYEQVTVEIDGVKYRASVNLCDIAATKVLKDAAAK